MYIKFITLTRTHISEHTTNESSFFCKDGVNLSEKLFDYFWGVGLFIDSDDFIHLVDCDFSISVGLLQQDQKEFSGGHSAQSQKRGELDCWKGVYDWDHIAWKGRLFQDTNSLPVFLFENMGEMGGNRVNLRLIEDVFSVKFADKGEEVTLLGCLVHAECANYLVWLLTDWWDENKRNGFFDKTCLYLIVFDKGFHSRRGEILGCCLGVISFEKIVACTDDLKPRQLVDVEHYFWQVSDVLFDGCGSILVFSLYDAFANMQKSFLSGFIFTAFKLPIRSFGMISRRGFINSLGSLGLSICRAL
jgi:hypothetical protein